MESEIEKLIQYLCYEVGNLDSRFLSEFLIRLEPTKAFVKVNVPPPMTSYLKIDMSRYLVQGQIKILSR